MSISFRTKWVIRAKKCMVKDIFYLYQKNQGNSEDRVIISSKKSSSGAMMKIL